MEDEIDVNEDGNGTEPETEPETEQASDTYDSILNSVKKSLNISPEIVAFDPDIILLVNSALSKLHQMGVGPEDTFSITDSSSTWDDFYTNKDINMVRQYVYMEVRLAFDPPTASVLNSFEKIKAELEWRLNVEDDDYIYKVDQNGI